MKELVFVYALHICVYISTVLYCSADMWCFFTMSGSHILHIVFCKYIFLLMIISPL